MDRICLLAYLFISLSLLSCRKSPAIYTRSQYLMGTTVEITVVASDAEKANMAITAGFQEIRRLEKLMSVYLPESEFSRINAQAGESPVKVSPENIFLIKKAMEIADLTAGGFNPAISPAINIWGGLEEEIPNQNELEQVRPLLNYREIKIDDKNGMVFLPKKGMSINPGGIGKGYAADRAMEVVKGSGIDSGIVAVAGDIRVFGRRPEGGLWKIGIKHPRQEGLIASVEFTEWAISTSGDYERFFMKEGKRYHHILDPQTLQPAMECQGVTIIAKEGIMADGLATGVFVLGPEKGMKLIERLTDVEGLIIDKDGRITISSGMSNYGYRGLK